MQLALAQESFKRHTLFVTRPRFSSFPQPNRERLSHEVKKRRRLSGGSPRPSTRSRENAQAVQGLSPTLHTKSTKDTGYEAWHLPTSCVFFWWCEAGRAEHTGGEAGGRTGQQRRWPGGRTGQQRRWPGGRGAQTAKAPRTNTKTLWAGANAPAHSRLVKTPVLTRT